MFSRRDPTPPPPHPRETPGEQVEQPETRAVPPTAVIPVPEPPAATPESVVASTDTFEGTLRTATGVRVLGTVQGSIEAQQYVRVEAGAQVEADIRAQEVVIAGTYRGHLQCHNRVEIEASGRVRGKLETNKLSLHEGGFFDGELHMQPPEDEAPQPAGRGRLSARPPRYSATTGEPSASPEGDASTADEAGSTAA